MKNIPGARFLYRAIQTRNRAISSKRVISAYLANYALKKLHIGCGGNILAGWLNSDYFPSNNPNVIHLDATERFPFPDNMFDYIFSEHMIEHVKYAEGLLMLKECNRSLKAGGRIRISTPDLQFLIDLYSDHKSDLQKNYIKHSSDLHIRNGEYSDTMIINNFVRDWGHLFIYDKKTLRRSLELSGFINIVSYKVNESDNINLKDLENVNRMPIGFLQLESFTLEAIKP